MKWPPKVLAIKDAPEHVRLVCVTSVVALQTVTHKGMRDNKHSILL